MKKLFVLFLILFPAISMAIVVSKSNGVVLSSSGDIDPHGVGLGGSVSDA